MKPLSRICWALLVLSIALVVSSCRVSDHRKCKIRVPGLKNQACAERIADGFREYMMSPILGGAIKPGSVRFNVGGRWVEIEYDSMKVAMKNLEHVVASAGFDANDVLADTNAVAALPPECR